MRFSVRNAPVPQMNGDYATMKDGRGGYRRWPHGHEEKADVAHLVAWLCEKGSPGVLRLEDGREFEIRPENHDAVLTALGFKRFVGVKWTPPVTD